MKKRFYMLIIFSIYFSSCSNTINDEQSAPAQSEAPVNFDEIVFNWSRALAQTIDIAHKKHYKIDNLEESMIKSIDGFVSTLDAHSSFLDPKTYKDMIEKTSGEIFGVGIVVDNMRKKKDKHLTVIDTIPDGPADKAGILPLDKIVEVNGKILENMATEEIIGLIKGEKNTVVTVKVMRENCQELLSFDLKRDVVKEQHSLSFYLKNHNIAYLSLSMFTSNAAEQLERLLKKLETLQCKGLILDLRNNSGGLLSSVIDIAGLFLQKNSLIAITKDKSNQEIERYSTKRSPLVRTKLPIFILINNYTASAGEILAGCLKIHSDQTNSFLAFLVGTKTFGKGSVQEIIPVSNNCALKLTTHLYFLPDNTTIQGNGIEPDFVIEKTMPQPEQIQWFTKHYGRESSLEHYIKINGTPPTPEEKKETTLANASDRRHDRAKKMLEQDNQFRDCVMLINMLDTAQKYTPELVISRAGAVEYLKNNFISNDTLAIEEIN